MKIDPKAFMGMKLAVEIADPENDLVFRDIISGVIEIGIFNERELADGLLVSKPSVNRWSRGISLPRKVLRSAIYKWLLGKMNLRQDIAIAYLKDILATPDKNDDGLFEMTISTALEMAIISEGDIAREFGLSRPTVQRWSSGESNSHPTLRPRVYKWLLDKVSELEDKNRQS
ncbi:MAG: hypothetical protein Q8R55_07990 [Candidatus Taylorbacteria bacterium]|nr:hypothetical protein [Candidatus Taylorbacteria bacterium]